MSKTKDKEKDNAPQRTKWGVRVYYDGQTENYLRDKAKKRGFVNVQKMLEYDARKEREKAQGRDD